jgi:hypothetical protein
MPDPGSRWKTGNIFRAGNVRVFEGGGKSGAFAAAYLFRIRILPRINAGVAVKETCRRKPGLTSRKIPAKDGGTGFSIPLLNLEAP